MSEAPVRVAISDSVATQPIHRAAVGNAIDLPLVASWWSAANLASVIKP